MNLSIIIKFLLSAFVITAASEIAKRNVSLGALLCALPLTSLLVIIWTWVETGDQARVVSLNWSILAYTIPSFVFFILFPLGLRLGLHFWFSLAGASLLTALTYRLLQPWLDRVG